MELGRPSRPFASAAETVDLDERVRVLILGATGEARRLAELLAPRPELEVMTSAGGAASAFGGTDDLVVKLAELRPDAVVDAMHAYSQTISRYARRACAAAGIPRLRLERPGWTQRAGDDWRLADDLAGAIDMACGIGKRLFISAGKVPAALLDPFPDHWFLIRSAEPMVELPENVRTVAGKGPFTRGIELDLLDGHRIDVVIAKMAGGSAAYAKIEAARELGLPVVLLKRPDPPPGPIASSVTEALDWLELVVESCREP